MHSLHPPGRLPTMQVTGCKPVRVRMDRREPQPGSSAERSLECLGIKPFREQACKLRVSHNKALLTDTVRPGPYRQKTGSARNDQ